MIKDIIIVVLVLISLMLITRLILIRRNLKEISRELNNTKDEDYNRQLKVILSDKTVEKLAADMNQNLDYQKSLKMETEKSRRQLEQSISDIAHDLRTPLTVIKGNLQMLENEELSDKGREYLDISRRKADTLKEMVDEFFELSVLESDSKSVELCKLDLMGFLSEFIIENETLIREKDLSPKITFPERTIYVRASKEMLSRVFNNLITNILKYAKDDFELVVEQDDDENAQAVVKVSNHVDDPSAIDIEHIFDRTYRADKARSDGSAGLGLYIAKLLVEKQKGSMQAYINEDLLVFEVKLNV
ncbi:MAG: HAMP domain-containing histidine kinase [Eubacterium sp.]|nr:HAMP domain-containing histidine kinase [Eubacterium sp.]